MYKSKIYIETQMFIDKLHMSFSFSFSLMMTDSLSPHLNVMHLNYFNPRILFITSVMSSFPSQLKTCWMVITAALTIFCKMSCMLFTLSFFTEINLHNSSCGMWCPSTFLRMPSNNSNSFWQRSMASSKLPVSVVFGITASPLTNSVSFAIAASEHPGWFVWYALPPFCGKISK